MDEGQRRDRPSPALIRFTYTSLTSGIKMQTVWSNQSSEIMDLYLCGHCHVVGFRLRVWALMMEVGSHGRAVWQRNVRALPLWGPEMVKAVMLRELAKDEEVTLAGSELSRGPWDLFLFTTLSLISSAIVPFISLSVSAFHVLLSLVVSGACVPGSLSLSPPASFSRCLFASNLPWTFNFPFSPSPPSFYLPPHFFHFNRSDSISSPPPHCWYLLFKPWAVPLYVLPPLYRRWPTSVSTCNCTLDWECHSIGAEVSNPRLPTAYVHMTEYIISSP